MTRYGTKILAVGLVVALLSVLMVNFDSVFPDLNCDALAVSQTVKQKDDEVPNSINFIDEDKNAFINYCKEIYGNKLPMEIDKDVFHYYGTVNGFRFYRLAATYIPSENILRKEVVGGYTFESASRFRPSDTGLYIIGKDRVMTLKEANDNGLIDIAKVYRLYEKGENK